MAFQINISGYIGEVVMGFGEEACYNLSMLNSDLANMPESETEIDVYINSGGGWVNEGFAIYDRLVSLPQTVNTIVLGTCGSIATIIAQAGKKGTRKMYQNSEYFIHNPWFDPSCGGAYEAQALLDLANELFKSQKRILDFYIETTGKEASVLSAKMEAATTLSAAEAKDLGFIDEVITTSLSNQTKYRIAAYAGNFNNTSKNNNDMDLKEMFENFAAKMTGEVKEIKAAIRKGTINNAMVHTTSGTAVYYDGELNVGTKLYTDEAMTMPLADGDYVIGENMHVVKAGEVVEIKPVSVDAKDTEIANLKAELETLKAEKETLNAAKTEAETQAATAVQKAEALASDFQNFRNTVMTGDKLKPEYVQNFDRGGNGEPDWKTKLQEVQAAKKKK